MLNKFDMNKLRMSSYEARFKSVYLHVWPVCCSFNLFIYFIFFVECLFWIFSPGLLQLFAVLCGVCQMQCIKGVFVSPHTQLLLNTKPSSPAWINTSAFQTTAIPASFPSTIYNPNQLAPHLGSAPCTSRGCYHKTVSSLAPK